MANVSILNSKLTQLRPPQTDDRRKRFNNTLTSIRNSTMMSRPKKTMYTTYLEEKSPQEVYIKCKSQLSHIRDRMDSPMKIAEATYYDNSTNGAIQK